MKRHGNLYEKIANIENLKLAYYKAKKGRSLSKSALLYRYNLEENIKLLRSDLINGNVKVGNYNYFTIYDPKERVICAASFNERVLHHAIINIIESIFDSYLIYDSYACRVGMCRENISKNVMDLIRGTFPKEIVEKIDFSTFTLQPTSNIDKKLKA